MPRLRHREKTIPWRRCVYWLWTINAAYDMKEILLKTVDNSDFLETRANLAPNLITGFARYGGMSVGISAKLRI